MFRLLRFLFVAIAGLVLGQGSVWYALDDPRFDFSARIGAWHVVDGGDEADPYALARMARSGAVGLASWQGVALVLTSDAEGRSLAAACHYLLSGPMPEDTVWTVAVTDRDGKIAANPAGRRGFTAFDAMRFDRNAVHITLGPTMRPGDFLPTSGLEAPRVTLRLYGANVSRHLPAADSLPTLVRTECPEPRA